jgi:hypothetical protein
MRHTGQRPYRCNYCSYTCIQAISIKMHMKNKHPNATCICRSRGWFLAWSNLSFSCISIMSCNWIPFSFSIWIVLCIMLVFCSLSEIRPLDQMIKYIILFYISQVWCLFFCYRWPQFSKKTHNETHRTETISMQLLQLLIFLLYFYNVL